MKQAKSICTICGTEFPYRKGKFYCSNSCKTKGYNLKKQGIEIAGIENKNITPYSQERTTFYLSDYNKLKSNDFCSFEQYCFLIKRFADDESIELLNEYAEYIINDEKFANNISTKSHPLGARYFDFLNIFHDGKYLIKKDRITKNQSSSVKS